MSENRRQPASHDSVTRHESGDPGAAGKHLTRRGEDVVKEEGVEAGRHHHGTQGKTRRPVGGSDERDTTAVDPQRSKH